jgi:ankyrin repeat protein
VAALFNAGATAKLQPPPLHLAAQSGSLATVRCILTADPSAVYDRDADEQTVIHRAARTDAGRRITGLLFDAWTNPSSSAGTTARAGSGSGGGGGGGSGGSGYKRGGGCGGKNSALAAQARSLPCLAVDRWGRTPLHWAVVNGHRTAVAVLLENGADVSKSVPDHGNETALQVAERRAQCRAQDRPDGLRPSVFGDIATQLGGRAKTTSEADM